MSLAASDPAPPALREEGLAAWRQFHLEAMARMSELAGALDSQGWPGVERACRWAREAFQRHHPWEEQRLFPLLAQAGAEPLREQLRLEHREMDDLAGAVLDGGPAADPGPPARRLLDLVRQHLDTELHRMLPLIQGREPGETSGAGAGYLSPPRSALRRSGRAGRWHPATWGQPRA